MSWVLRSGTQGTMFHVARYDPSKNNKRKNADSDTSLEKRTHSHIMEGRKRKRGRKEGSTEKPTIKPIATEQKPNRQDHKTNTPSAKEAFDDLDIILEPPADDNQINYADQEPDPASEGTRTTGEASSSEIQMAIRMSKLPLEKSATLLRLAPFLVERLRKAGYQCFLPIQALSLAHVVLFSDSQYQYQDVCIAAPTGSGKTLAYCLPILHSLSQRPRGCVKRRRLRALVVLPSRDLAAQVYDVFQEYIQGDCDVKIGLSIGQTDFLAEQIALTVDKESNDPNMLRHWLSLDPSNLDVALRLGRRCGQADTLHVDKNDTMSNIDVLVCTPGRLVDHMDKTPGFTVRHLQFLIVDEADRLINQSYHNWMDRIIKAHPSFDNVKTNSRRQQLRKFLVSATMTRDPQKLAPLRLNNPKELNVKRLLEKSETSLYSMPDSLKEYTVECTAEQKPLVLLALLLDLTGVGDSEKYERNLVVVFTSSLDSTHRLARLLQLLWSSVVQTVDANDDEDDEEVIGSAVREYSSALSQTERAHLVQSCHDGRQVSVVVCSDGMSRGMDLPNVAAVVNYDVPTAAKTYVHRSGRTARAGAKGTAVSLLKGAGQAGQFKSMRRLVHEPERVGVYQLRKSLVRNVPYRQCVAALRRVLDAEDNRELQKTQGLNASFLKE